MRISDWSSDVCSSDLIFAIILDDEVISAPRIQSAITGGSGIITGSFSVETAQDLALLLRAGALPAPVQYLEERTVGPGLGADSIAAGEIASVLGLIFVVIFMVVMYGLLGAMASTALVKIGRAHVCTPVTNAHLVCRHLLE